MTSGLPSLHVVGGTYVEAVREPHSFEVMGSGLRAAALLGQRGNVQLHTCLDPSVSAAAKSVAAAIGFEIVAEERPKQVRFYYTVPMSPPVIDGHGQDLKNLSLSSSSAPCLIFGMLETDHDVEAPGIVFDPQRPRGPRPIDREKLRCQRFAVVANEAEIRQLGGSNDAVQVAPDVMRSCGADVLVLKRGPVGAVVFEIGKEPVQVGPRRSDSIWPIGSGDIFSAAFTWSWLVLGHDPVDSAKMASATTSRWCDTRSIVTPFDPGMRPDDLAHGVELSPRKEPVRVYLAAPFFSIAERWLVNLVRDTLSAAGCLVFSPLHDVGLGNDEVADRDLQGLLASEVVLALLDGADAGTLFEVGFAAASNIPVVGFAEHPKAESYKMLRGSGMRVTNELSTAIYHAVWSAFGEVLP